MKVDINIKDGEVSLKLIPENSDDSRVLYSFPFPMKGIVNAGSYTDGSVGIILR